PPPLPPPPPPPPPLPVAPRPPDAARRHLGTGLEYCAEHDIESCRLSSRGWLAVCAMREGDFACAVRIAEGLLRNPSLPVPTRMPPLVVLGTVRARRRQAGAAGVRGED